MSRVISQYNAVLSDDEFKALEEEHETQKFESRFDFLNVHKGLRPGKIHVLLGITSGGKSSLVRPIMLDCAKNSRVMVHLSEEAVIDYKWQLARQVNNKGLLKKLYLFSENADDTSFKKSFMDYWNWFEENVRLINPDVLFFDNITTSFPYSSLTFNEQNEFIDRLKNLAHVTGVSFFIVCHTKKEVNANWKHLIAGEDARGSNQLSQKADYFYILQSFRNEFGFNPTVKVEKSRFHQEAMLKFYALHYDGGRGTFVNDREIKFEELCELFRDRYQLKEKK